MERVYDRELLDFIQSSPSVYHMIAGQKQRLLAAGYTQLLESEAWELRPGGKYFLTRNGSAIAAFRVPEGDFRGIMIMASHSDFPALKIKEHPEIPVGGAYQKLNVELYGGALLAPWFDRPLSVAGRLFLRTAEGVKACLVDAGRDLVLIPSLAIHMNRNANAGQEYLVQRDLRRQHTKNIERVSNKHYHKAQQRAVEQGICIAQLRGGGLYVVLQISGHCFLPSVQAYPVRITSRGPS